jgi:hypothetical protein
MSWHVAIFGRGLWILGSGKYGVREVLCGVWDQVSLDLEKCCALVGKCRTAWNFSLGSGMFSFRKITSDCKLTAMVLGASVFIDTVFLMIFFSFCKLRKCSQYFKS